MANNVTYWQDYGCDIYIDGKLGLSDKMAFFWWRLEITEKKINFFNVGWQRGEVLHYSFENEEGVWTARPDVNRKDLTSNQKRTAVLSLSRMPVQLELHVTCKSGDGLRTVLSKNHFQPITKAVYQRELKH